ncbi:ABC transporter permease [Klebsiella pneumoniae]|uniref:ABC transporter permease n=1 Tax=Klebsiella pneumoniae TaxID=573 RepID=UPI000B951783|nr:iron ABC transporter permease [Klebsiella pneumoniae]EKT9723073.1 iron ABC transporter permease [Klebsiella pneumoniae]EKW6093954.1 iron ABC transporter permease [Klebsiella pneumoniae]OYI26350.1 ABC transporter permease [Klebsiella pneumoniae subsp. pneumoniae]HBR0583630.1 iron ABC transporter permease [Klebsiella pneumoniae]
MKQTFLSGATLAALVMLVALPLVFIVLQAIFPHFSAGSLGDAFGGIPALLADPQLPAMLGGTLWIAAGVALVSVMIGLPLGILRGIFSLPLPRLWDLLFLIPFLTPPYISALSWMLALQSQGYLQQLTGWQLNDLLFSRSGIVLVMTFNIFPVVYFAVSRSLLASGTRLAVVARVHGASAWRAFWHVTLPMLSPALAAGMLLAFTLAIEEFGVSAALGSRAGVVMLTVGIEKKLADWPVDLPGAALLSLLLMAVALFAWWLQRRLVGEKEVTSVTGKPGENHGASLGWMMLPAVLAMAAVGGLAVGVPAVSMMLTSVMGTLSGGVSVENVTLRHFAALFDQQGDALSALGTSLSLALGSALIVGALGLLAAWLVMVQKIKGRGMVDALSLMPAALPGVVVGVGLILLWNQPFWPRSPYNTLWMLLLSYCCLLLPWPVRYVGSALRQLGPNLEPAARVHGASPLQALRLIVLPLVFPALMAAMLMVFAVASRELVTSLLLSPAGTQTVAVFIWRQFEQGSVGQGMAMASLTLLTGLVLMLTALALMQRRTCG